VTQKSVPLQPDQTKWINWQATCSTEVCSYPTNRFWKRCMNGRVQENQKLRLSASRGLLSLGYVRLATHNNGCWHTKCSRGWLFHVWWYRGLLSTPTLQTAQRALRKTLLCRMQTVLPSVPPASSHPAERPCIRHRGILYQIWLVDCVFKISGCWF
jgi:hypothetical protein